MGQPVIGAYQGDLGDGDAELEALGTTAGKRFFLYAQKIVSRKVDHWTLRTFAEFRDVPVYKAEFDDSFTLFTVEDDPDQGITLMLFLACKLQPGHVGGKAWDGRDFGYIRDAILLPRLRDYFG